MELEDYTVDAENGIVYGYRGRPIRARDSKGYVHFTIWKNGRQRVIGAHRFIWEHVNGPIPDGLMINHINADKADNRIENLELVTKSGNALHAVRLGLWPAGERHPSHRLTNDAVNEIRAIGRTIPARKLAKRYGVSPSLIDLVIWGKIWKQATTRAGTNRNTANVG